MYDQYGFYSENGYPGAGAGAAVRSAAVPTWISAASISPISRRSGGAARRRGGTAHRTPAAAASATSFRQFFGGAAARSRRSRPKRAPTSSTR